VPPRSFIVLEDSNDYARCSRDTKFKSIVLREIRAADDIAQCSAISDVGGYFRDRL
jgi:hypothetical protein